MCHSNVIYEKLCFAAQRNKIKPTHAKPGQRHQKCHVISFLESFVVSVFLPFFFENPQKNLNFLNYAPYIRDTHSSKTLCVCECECASVLKHICDIKHNSLDLTLKSLASPFLSSRSLAFSLLECAERVLVNVAIHQYTQCLLLFTRHFIKFSLRNWGSTV